MSFDLSTGLAFIVLNVGFDTVVKRRALSSYIRFDNGGDDAHFSTSRETGGGLVDNLMDGIAVITLKITMTRP